MTDSAKGQSFFCCFLLKNLDNLEKVCIFAAREMVCENLREEKQGIKWIIYNDSILQSVDSK